MGLTQPSNDDGKNGGWGTIPHSIVKETDSQTNNHNEMW